MCSDCARPIGADKDRCPVSEHFPESSIGQETLAHCKTCNRQTRHVIVRHSEHAGRVGHCLEHEAPNMTRKQRERIHKIEQERRNPRLF